MFGFLEESERMDFDPIGWTNSFVDSSGRPIDVMEQQDTEEFLNLMLDSLEKSMKQSSCPQVFSIILMVINYIYKKIIFIKIF